MPHQTVLVFTSDRRVSPLIRDLIEAEGFRVVFSAAEDSPSRALDLADCSIALIDCDHSAACTGEFLREAGGRGVRVILFSPGRRDYEVGDIARAYGMAYFAMPITRAELRGLLESARSPTAESIPGARAHAVRSERDRRQRASSDRTVIYRDAAGRVWQVYDRRNGEDRRTGAGHAPAGPGYRAFVADDGDERHYPLGPDGDEGVTADDLARQFTRALRPSA